MRLFKREPLPTDLKKKRNKERLLVIVSALLLGLSYPPVPLPFLAFGAFIPLLWVLERRDSLAALNRAAYLFGFVFAIITLYWVGAFTEMKDDFLMIGGALTLLYYPVYLLIPVTLYYFARKHLNAAAALYLFPVFWITQEFILNLTDLHFPWLALGNTAATINAFIQPAELIGVMGISLIIVYINVLVYQGTFGITIKRRKFSPQFIIAAVLIIIPLIYGAIRISGYKVPEEYVKVGVIQPAIDPYDKWNGGSIDDLLNTYLSLSEEVADSSDIILWPETALPVYLLSGSHSELVNRISDFTKRHSVSIMTGMPHIAYFPDSSNAPDDVKKSLNTGLFYGTYNSILLFSPYETYVQQYGKVKLVPFGEKTPLVRDIPFIADLFKWGVGLSSWNEGQDTTVFYMVRKDTVTDASADTVCIGGLVCFESVFPFFVPAFTGLGAQFFAVLTNDSWYGNTSGPYQHKEIAVLRAVENRRSVVRAANGGISCIIDPLGRTITETNYNQRTAFYGNVPLADEHTFFSRYPMIIPIAAAILSIWILALALLKRVKKLLKL
jgi:apolipoprotein N-acyltransferase